MFQYSLSIFLPFLKFSLLKTKYCTFDLMETNKGLHHCMRICMLPHSSFILSCWAQSSPLLRMNLHVLGRFFYEQPRDPSPFLGDCPLMSPIFFSRFHFFYQPTKKDKVKNCCLISICCHFNVFGSFGKRVVCFEDVKSLSLLRLCPLQEEPTC